MDELAHRRSLTATAADRRTAFARLVDDEQNAMVRMATLMIGSAAVAEEVVQDALAAVDQRWDSIERPGAYLRRSVVNGCAMVLRRRTIEERAARLEPRPPDVELPTQLVELRDALDRLSERQRIVVVLRYFVDLPDDQIAEALGVRRATVRSVARRALHVLRTELT